MSKPANPTYVCAACGRNFKSVKHAGSRSGSHEFVTVDAAAKILEKIDVLWFENVEFSLGAPLAWDEFFGGFSDIEKAVYTGTLV